MLEYLGILSIKTLIKTREIPVFFILAYDCQKMGDMPLEVV